MFDDPLILCLLLFFVFSGGFIDAFGGGGGAIIIPSMLTLGVPPHFALGTNTIFATVGSWGIINYIRNKAVVWSALGLLIVFGALGGWAGARFVVAIPEETLGQIFAILMPVMACFLLFREFIMAERSASYSGNGLWLRKTLIGFFSGFYSTIFPPGAGVIKVLLLKNFLGLAYLRSIATAKIFGMVIDFVALVTFAFYGKVLWGLAALLVVIYGAGNYVGSHIVLNIPDKFIRIALFVIVMALSVSLFFKYY